MRQKYPTSSRKVCVHFFFKFIFHFVFSYVFFFLFVFTLLLFHFMVDEWKICCAHFFYPFPLHLMVESKIRLHSSKNDYTSIHDSISSNWSDNSFRAIYIYIYSLCALAKYDKFEISLKLFLIWRIQCQTAKHLEISQTSQIHGVEKRKWYI